MHRSVTVAEHRSGRFSDEFCYAINNHIARPCARIEQVLQIGPVNDDVHPRSNIQVLGRESLGRRVADDMTNLVTHGSCLGHHHATLDSSNVPSDGFDVS